MVIQPNVDPSTTRSPGFPWNTSFVRILGRISSCSNSCFNWFMSSRLMVVKSFNLDPVSSISSWVLTSNDSIVTSNIGIDCFVELLTVIISFSSCRAGLNFSLVAAALEMKFRPEPVSGNAQNTSPFNLTGTIAGRVGYSATGVGCSVTRVYPVNTDPPVSRGGTVETKLVLNKEFLSLVNGHRISFAGQCNKAFFSLSHSTCHLFL